MPVFKSAVGLIIGDLLIGFHTKEAGWSYLSMSTSAFSDRPVGYKTFKPFVETMEAVGLIKVSVGRNSKNIQFDKSDKVTYSPGFATRFKPTPFTGLDCRKGRGRRRGCHEAFSTPTTKTSHRGEGASSEQQGTQNQRSKTKVHSH